MAKPIKEDISRRIIPICHGYDRPYDDKWHPYFALWPLETADGRWIWFKNIYRRQTKNFTYYSVTEPNE